MDENVKISVVIPVYNVAQYLSRCINSIMNQTFSDYEVILIDDGSTDSSGNLCDFYANEWNQIKVFHKENGGLSDARNYGVMKASGEWIVFIDSDDYVSDNYLSDLWEVKESYNADLVVGNITRVDEQGAFLSQTGFNSTCLLDFEHAFFDIYLNKKAEYNSYSKLIKKSTLMKYPFPKGYFEDFATTYLFLYDSNRIVISSKEPSYYYVQRFGSIINNNLKEEHFRAFDICDEINDFVNKYIPQYAKYTSLLYQGQTVQMLNKQHMSKEQYNYVFYKYNSLFRNSALGILSRSNLSIKIKVYRLLMCSNPTVYKCIQSLVAAIH